MGGTLIILTLVMPPRLVFTCFLSDEDSYKGIANIQTGNQRLKFRLPLARLSFILFDVHCVEPVVSGTRYVCVGWLESYVKSAEDRALLFHLDAGARGLLARHGHLMSLI